MIRGVVIVAKIKMGGHGDGPGRGTKAEKRLIRGEKKDRDLESRNNGEFIGKGN